MSLEAHQQGLFIVVSRKRERSPSAEGEDSPLLAPPTPPATDKKRCFVDDEEVDWGEQMPELADRRVPDIVQEPAKRSCQHLWWPPGWAHDNSLLVVHQDSNNFSNSNDDCSSRVPFAMPTTDLSTEESYNIGTRSGRLTLSREDLEDIANAAPPVTPSPTASGHAHDSTSVIAQQAPAIRGLQWGDPEDEGSCNFPGDSKHGHSVEEKSVGSSP